MITSPPPSGGFRAGSFSCCAISCFCFLGKVSQLYPFYYTSPGGGGNGRIHSLQRIQDTRHIHLGCPILIDKKRKVRIPRLEKVSYVSSAEGPSGTEYIREASE